MAQRSAAFNNVSVGRVYRLVALAALFFVSGLLFFFMHRTPTPIAPGLPGRVTLTPTGISSASDLRVIQAEQPLVLKNFPAPNTFRTVAYQSGNPVELKMPVICQAAYYTILLYPRNIDYRQNPSAAAYNTATACPQAGSLTAVVPLQQRGLAAGDYYVVRAHQGATGSWYEPY